MNSIIGFVVGLLQTTLSFLGFAQPQQAVQPDIQMGQPGEQVTPTTSTSYKTELCPKLTRNVSLGSKDEAQVPEWALGDVGALQQFLARRYGLDEKTFIDGIFG